MGNILFVYPVLKTSVVGRHNSIAVRRSDGHTIQRKNGRSAGIQIPLVFEKDSQTNLFISGLEKLVPNPFHTDANPNWANFPPSWSTEKERIESQEEITLQEYYEILDRVPKGTYTSMSGNKNMAQLSLNRKAYDQQTPTFLDEFTYYFSTDTCNVLDTNNGKRDRFAIQLCKNSKFIAPNKESVNEDKHLFYIGKAQEDNEQKKLKRNILQKAISIFGKLEEEHDSFTRYQFAILLDLTADVEIPDSNIVHYLSNYVWEDKVLNQPDKLVRARKLINLYKKYQDDFDAFSIDYLYKQALVSRVFRTEAGKTYWVTKREIQNLYDLGTSVKNIKARFQKELEVHDPNDTENMYVLLTNDLKNRGVRL